MGSVFTALSRRFSGTNPQLRLFLAGMVLMGVAGGMYETTFNNFLADRFDIRADQRGFLEFPRELPGFLTALFAGLLFFLPETRIAAFSALATGVGMIGLAVYGARDWSWMLFYLLIWSVGTHLIMPVRSSISMQLAARNQAGRRLGQLQGASVAAGIVGCVLVWIAMRHLRAGYTFIFLVGGIAAVAGAAVLALMRMPGAHLQRPKFVWRREYWLYYVLAFLFGARKQVFLTFGPWVLIRVFHQQAYIFAQLWIVAGVLGVVFQPLLGRAIDRFGERAVLMADSLLLFGVCAGYGFADLIPQRGLALGVLYACFVGDQMLFGVNMARDLYLAKIAVSPQHIGPTLSLGVTINHAVSMSIPSAGGLLWMTFGHPAVFLAAAGIAVLMFVFASMVRVPRPASG